MKAWIGGFGVALALLAAAPSAQAPANGRQEFRGAYADLRFALRLLETKQYAQAEGMLRTLVEVQPGSAVMWTQLALCLQLQDENEEALAAVRRALEIEPERLQALWIAAELTAPTDRKVCSGYVDRIVEHATDARTLRRAARLSLACRELDRAAELASRAREMQPRDGETALLVADVALRQRDFATAEEAYRQAAELRPHDPTVLESLGRLLLLQGRREDAAHALHASLEIRPSNLGARRILIDVMRALDLPAEEIQAQQALLSYYEPRQRRVARPPGSPRGAAQPSGR